MDMKYEIRIRRTIDGSRWLWKICLLNIKGEPFIKIGLENTMDEAYKAAKKKYDALINAK